MDQPKDSLIEAITVQASQFLLELEMFYPFGTYIRNNNMVVPFSAYTGEEYPDVTDLIELLEKGIKNNDDYQIAAIAVDVTLRENDQPIDAMQVRIFKPDTNVAEVLYYKYHFDKSEVIFEPFDIG